MATVNQRKVFERVAKKVRNGQKVSVSKEMRGIYADGYAKHPERITRSNGWKDLCDENGLTDDFLLSALYKDIELKPQNRKAELELAFKVKGRLQEKESERVTNNILIINGDQTRRIAQRIIGKSELGSESGKETVG